ncbi:hypothetical protein B4Y56_16265, partial [Listeria monocytogenes]|nr:hypothetical protein [Listeria monocytogenes]
MVKQESFIARSKMAKISVNELYAKKQTTFVMQSVFQLFLFLVFSQCFQKDCFSMHIRESIKRFIVS